MRTHAAAALALLLCLHDHARPQPDSATLLSDFAPPRGAAHGFAREGEGAWQKRLMTAVSTDGLTFSRTNEIVTDQGNVPDLILDAQGRLYLYYSAGIAGERNNVMAVAVSLDQGKTWCYKYVEIEGAGRMPSPGDPDVRLLPDGTFRLFFTSAEPEARGPQIFYAEGTDGIHFVKRGPAFGSGTEPVMDSFTVPIGGAWHMYTLGGIAGKVWHGISEDGRTFRFHDHADFSIGGRWYIPTNELPLEDGRVRFYAFAPGPGGDVRSFLTADGYGWEEEPGARLAPDASSGLEQEFVKDAAVARLGDGSYLMVYVTTIPE